MDFVGVGTRVLKMVVVASSCGPSFRSLVNQWDFGFAISNCRVDSRRCAFTDVSAGSAVAVIEARVARANSAGGISTGPSDNPHERISKLRDRGAPEQATIMPEASFPRKPRQRR